MGGSNRKLTPLAKNRYYKFLKAHGWSHKRTKKHEVWTNPNLNQRIPKPVVIPKDSEVSVGVILQNLKNMGLTRNDLFNWLDSEIVAPPPPLTVEKEPEQIELPE